MNTLSLARIDLLRRHRMLPPDVDALQAARVLDVPGGLLSLLHETWSQTASSRESPSQRRCAERRAAWLEMQLRQQAALTWGLPGCSPDLGPAWVGERLVWWPRGVPAGQRVAFVSSRLGRPLEKHGRWFALLRSLCQSLDPDHDILLSARATAVAPFLDRCRELFGVRILEFVPAGRSTRTLSQWLAACRRESSRLPEASGLHWPAFVSPELAAGPSDPSPLQDRLVVAAADRIVALRVRAGGHVEQLLRRRLTAQATDALGSLLLAGGADLVRPSVVESLCALGAAPLCVESLSLPHVGADIGAGSDACPGSGNVLPLDQIATADYLTHCTRNATGPWPDESVEDYQDALILARPTADHSAFATLSRIVRQQQLLASGRTIRGGCRVVCFTAVDVKEIGQLRTFRAHRGRWDFEPYGICIKSRWLQQRAARPVCYGDAALWAQLAEPQRPFYQRNIAGKSGQIDWSVEREWRHVGTLDLSDLPATEAFLFVPTIAEAERLATFSRWPVVVLR